MNNQWKRLYVVKRVVSFFFKWEKVQHACWWCKGPSWDGKIEMQKKDCEQSPWMEWGGLVEICINRGSVTGGKPEDMDTHGSEGGYDGENWCKSPFWGAALGFVAARSFSSCGAQASSSLRLLVLGSVVVACGVVAAGHVESSRTRDGTCVPCVGRQILNHWTTREVLEVLFWLLLFSQQNRINIENLWCREKLYVASKQNWHNTMKDEWKVWHVGTVKAEWASS